MDRYSSTRSIGNYYYSDTEAQGGYNHMEIRRAKRLYTQGANKKGDLAIPMQQTKIWLQDEVIGF